MFLGPFLHYLKPYKLRLTGAILGMALVGLLAAAPILWIKETIDVFILSGNGSVEEMDAGAGAISRLMTRQPTSEPRSLASRAQERLPDWLTSRPPVRVALDRADALELWYQQQKTTEPYRALVFLVVSLILLITIKGLATYLSEYQLAYTFYRTNLQIREDLFANIVRQDYLYFNRWGAGWLHSRINSDVRSMQAIMESMITAGVQEPFSIIALLGLMFYYDWRLTLGVLIIAPLVTGILYNFARALRKNTRQEKKRADQLSLAMTESLNNIRLVKAFGTETTEVKKFHARTQSLFKYMMARRVAKFASRPIMEWFGTVAAGGVILVGGWMIIVGRDVGVMGWPLLSADNMTFSKFVAYLVAMSRLHRPMRGLASLVNKWQVARVSGERMSQMLDLRPAIKEVPDALPFERLREAIEFQDVDFCYQDKQVLRGISLRVEAGRRVAFVGPSGSGKTTLVNILARLFDAGEGRVLIDGVELTRLRMADWRARLAIVTQDTVLFDDTIAQNIAYGADEIDMERVEAAARAANAHDFIMRLDGGLDYQTMVGPTGARLSGGQRQRLAIARALYRDPQILILDEATSALDSHSQSLVQEALTRLMEGRTTFIIAHRISTVRDADCIYVLNEGRIVEQGSHDQLAAQGGLYSALLSQTSEPHALAGAPPDSLRIERAG